MRDLTMHELDAELAEQLPARELMSTGLANLNLNLLNTAAAVNVSTIHQTQIGGNGNTQVAVVSQNAAAAAGQAAASAG